MVVKGLLREHYSISLKVHMWVPLEGETFNAPLEEGYTPVFWEFFNNGMRLRASSFVNSLFSAIGRAPDQLGPFAWATVTAFPVGCLSIGRVLGSKAPQPIPPLSKGKPEELISDQGVKDAPENIEALVQEETRKEPLDSSPVQCIWFPGQPSQERPQSPRRSTDTSAGFMPIGSEQDTKENLVSDHAVSEWKLRSEVDTLKECSQKTSLDFEKTKAELLETRSLLEDCLAEMESMNALLSAENSAATAIEEFKGSSLFRLPDISSHFHEYVSGLGKDYVVDLFEDIPDEDDEDMGAEEGDGKSSEGDEDVE
ncbi:hypothetical protein LIER_20852 [Lithospermum erythrorhizon]|uniref:Uncharacterized protein n=1 Tax=Lithospermum erythrorhizon TaxID=34254 RepID=A0AAV3QQG1_LITER